MINLFSTVRRGGFYNLNSLHNTNINPSSLIGLLIILLLSFPNTGWSGPHRTIKAELSHRLDSDHITPRWYQPLIDDYHPIGCGNVAWAITLSYWHKHKGKSSLFSDPNISSKDNNFPEVRQTMNKLAQYTETDFGQAGSAVYGRTWPKNMCKGVKFAKDKGYAGTRCLRIRGTEFNKFNQIANYLRQDKPVILTIKAKGRGIILDHMVVIEKAHKIQEKVGSHWRDREVKYLVNYGWGKASKWISVRQKGINKGKLHSAGSAFLIDVSRTPLPEARSANEAACKDWCRRTPGCKMCSTLPGCGPGYKPYSKKWTGAGKNWYACTTRPRSNRVGASESNRQECQQWCAAHRHDKGCLKCSTKHDCGVGYRNLKSWTGYGNNWHACRKTGQSSRERASDQNHRQCIQWCNSNKPECIKCSKKKGCGTGFKNLKSWTGYGTNWHACKQNKYGRESQSNQKQCNDWCDNNNLCEECSTKKYCGAGLTPMKHFTGAGMNYHACRKTGSQSNQQACQQWCNNSSQCAKCSDKSTCGRGYKTIKMFRGPGKNWFGCKAR